MDLDFDDALSEDWISQPRSSYGPSIHSEGSTQSASAALFPRSRIPRPQSQTRTKLEGNAPVLNEKSASDLNIKKVNESTKPRIDSPKTDLQKNRAANGSISITPHGTVQHKEQIAPVNKSSKPTPEWRKRLLQGGQILGQQQDLFSPMGLETVFQPPQQGEHGSRPRVSTKEAEPQLDSSAIEFPSSPPVYRRFGFAKDNQKAVVPTTAWQVHQATKRKDCEDSINHGDAVLNDSSSLLTAQKIGPQGTESASGSKGSTQSNDKVENKGSQIRHETLSYIGPRHARISSVSVNDSIQRLQEKLSDLGIEEQARPSSRSSDSGLDVRPWRALFKQREKRDDGSQDQRLRLLSRGSFDDFVTIKRGGYSFDSSFRRRSLSPSSFQPVSSPLLPPLPCMKRQPEGLSEGRTNTPPNQTQPEEQPTDQPRSSGSPLKLFDKYDTFTNDHLARRISQFDTGQLDNTRDPGQADPTSPLARKKRSFGALHDTGSRMKPIGRPSSFGIGQLNDFPFTHRKQSFERSGSMQSNRGHAEARLHLPRPRSRHSRSISKASFSRGRNERPVSTETCEPLNATSRSTSPDLPQPQPVGKDSNSQLCEGKRIVNSPQNSPKAKRRRTNEYGLSIQRNWSGLGDATSQMASIVGKKRKDAKYENSPRDVDPEKIASRRILHPKALQSNQDRRPSHMSLVSELAGIETWQSASSNLDRVTEIIADDIARVAVDVAQDITSGVRKKSITTADFFEEANIIMRHIRNQARLDPGLAREDTASVPFIESLEEHTEEFSRPASREGISRKQAVSRPIDARVVSHLRKFEEADEPDSLALSSSLGQFPMPQGHALPESLLIQSDPPNMRVHEGLHQSNVERTRDYQVGEDNPVLTQDSDKTSGTSNHSVPTTSSSGSRNKATIAPDKVSHLIGDKMGKMTFDYERRCWVRRRVTGSTDEGSSCRVDSDATEENLLQNIPDLSVDESQEIGSGQRQQSSQTSEASENSRRSTEQTITDTCTGAGNNPVSSRRAEEKAESVVATTKPEPTTQEDESAGLAISHPNEATNESSKKPSTSTATKAAAELDMLEGRSAADPNTSKTQARRPRVVTVTFSSPLVNSAEPGHHDSQDDVSELGISDRPTTVIPFKTQLKPSARSYSRRTRNVSSTLKKSSLSNPQFTSRAISRIDENSEAEFTDSSRVGALVTTPESLLNPPKNRRPPRRPANGENVDFHLSTLPEFTIHQANETLNLDFDYVAKHHGLVSIPEVEGRFSIAVQDLVHKVSQIEPYELYWEYIRRLDLSGRGLLTLHMLADFCFRIEDLNVSHNQLGQLNGAPESLRSLSVRQNCLSDLTAWGHLRNLQYLDISGNQIQSLKGFNMLIHLRELKVVRNKIDSLEGILKLDGLLKLNLRGNLIKKLDFGEFDL